MMCIVIIIAHLRLTYNVSLIILLLYSSYIVYCIMACKRQTMHLYVIIIIIIILQSYILHLHERSIGS